MLTNSGGKGLTLFWRMELMMGEDAICLERIREHLRQLVLQTYGEEVRSPDAFKVATNLGIEYRPLPQEPSDKKRAAGSSILSVRSEAPEEDWFVFLDQATRIERQQFDLAHEIIEQYILDHPALLESAGHEAEELHPDDLLDQAHRLACYCVRDFLIDRKWLARDFEEVDGHLLKLKQLYPRASHELIAYATLPLLGLGAALTILDEPAGQPRRIYRRMRSDFRPIQEPLTVAERELAEACFLTSEPQEARCELQVEAWRFQGFAELRAYPVFEKKWRRVFVYLRAEEAD